MKTRVTARGLLLAAFFLVSVLPLLLFGAAFWPTLRGHLAEDIASSARSNLTATASQIATNVFDRPRSVLPTLLMLADTDPGRGPRGLPLEALLSAFAVSRPEYAALLVLGPGGEIESAYGPSGAAARFSPGSFYQLRASPVPGDVAFSRPFLDGGRLAIEASFSNPRKTVVGLLDLDVISSRLALSTRSPRDRAGVLDESGCFVACSDPSRVLDREPLRLGEAGAGRLPLATDQGLSYYSSSVPIGGSSWRAVYLSSRDEADAPSRAFVLRLAIVGAASVAGAFGVAFALKTTFAGPLANLASRIGMISAGRYDERVDHNFLAEFEGIGVAFNAMADSIQRRDREIQRNEARMASSLAEKTLLLKEVYHRVKNNLQIISSLLNMQASIAGDGAVAIALRDGQDRVYAMALVHELVYQMDDLCSIDVAEYASRLALHAADAYSASRDLLRLEIEGLKLELERAIPFGLALNELLSNAFKYASRSPVKVSLLVLRDGEPRARDGEPRVRLSVEDEGPGMPDGGPEDRSSSLGLSLIKGLAEQLEGEVSWRPGRGGKGTIVSLEFPLAPSDAEGRRA